MRLFFGVIAVCILGAGTNNRLVRGMMDLVKTAAYYIARAIAVCISFLLSLFSGKEGEMIEDGGGGPADGYGPVRSGCDAGLAGCPD